MTRFDVDVNTLASAVASRLARRISSPHEATAHASQARLASAVAQRIRGTQVNTATHLSEARLASLVASRLGRTAASRITTHQFASGGSRRFASERLQSDVANDNARR